MAEWIGHVCCEPDIEAKIQSKHAVTKREVDEAVVACPLEDAQWDDDPQYGLRLLVIGRTYHGRRLRVILRPIDSTDGTWELGTAFELVGR